MEQSGSEGKRAKRESSDVRGEKTERKANFRHLWKQKQKQKDKPTSNTFFSTHHTVRG